MTMVVNSTINNRQLNKLIELIVLHPLIIEIVNILNYYYDNRHGTPTTVESFE